jgi:hypothetical protein
VNRDYYRQKEPVLAKDLLLRQVVWVKRLGWRSVHNKTPLVNGDIPTGSPRHSGQAEGSTQLQPFDVDDCPR